MRQRRVMMLAAWALGLAGFVASAPSARAEFYDYTTTITIDPASVTPAGSTVTNAPGGGTADFQTVLGNAIHLTAQSSGTTIPHATGLGFGSTAPVLEIQAVAGDTLENLVGFNFTGTITLSNFPTATSTTPTGTNSITYSGRLEGPLGAGQSDIKLLNFAAPPDLKVDGETYFFSLQGYSAPGTDLSGVGGITLRIVARSVPEPGSLALLGMGGAGALGMFLRRRARATA